MNTSCGKSLNVSRGVGLLASFLLLAPLHHRLIGQVLIDVDFGGGAATAETGPAATGHSPSDFWNYYTRNDPQGGWRSFGILANLKTVEGDATGVNLSIANAPGSWGSGSADDMYNSYDYPFDGGNIAITITNLADGSYDLYVYGLDSRYELSAGGLSFGVKQLPGGPVVNPVAWQENLQYALFRLVEVTNGSEVALTVRPGVGGYATIAGLQIAATVTTNRPPVAATQNLLIAPDQSLPIKLAAIDPDGDALSYRVTTLPSHGSITGSAPNLVYTPAPSFAGSDQLTFVANDGQLDSAPALVQITVSAAATLPLIDIDIGGGSATTEVGPAATGHSATDFWNYYTRNDDLGGWRSLGSLANLKNVEGLMTGVGLTIANAPGAWGNGSLDEMYSSYDYPFDGGNIHLTITNLSAGAYDLYVYGIDSTYEVTVQGQSYGVQALPAGPVVNPVVWQEGLQYTRFRSVKVAAGNEVSITVRPGAGGYATLSGLQIAAVLPTNHLPVANAQVVFATEETPQSITLTGSDLDGEALTYAVASPPTHGSLSGTAPALVYTSDPGFTGSDTLTFTVNDGHGTSAPATIILRVLGSGTTLLIDVDFGGGSATTEQGPAATGHSIADFWNYYTRNDGQGGWRSFGTLSNLMSVEGAATGAGLTIANAPGSWGSGSADDMYNSYNYPFDGGNVTVTVTNLAPGAYDFYVYGIDSTYELSVGSENYGTKPLPAGPIVNPVTWQEDLQYVRFQSVLVANDATATLQVRPGAGGYATIAGLQIAAVVPTNHAPVGSAQSVTVSENSAQAITLTGRDPERDPLTYSLVSQPGHGLLSGTPPSLLYTPAPGFTGPDSFTFTVNDGELDSDPALVTITVLSAATAPLINVDIGGGSATSEVGPAATGHGASDFWNYYTRNDGHGGWLTFGGLGQLKTAEGVPTGAGLTIANAPGSWGCGSADDMYNSYNYPFDGGNIILTLTNLDLQVYDFYVYGIGSSYQLSVGSQDYGAQTLPAGPVVNPTVWQEGLQYARFTNVQILSATQSMVVTVTPGGSGYATIAGLQLAARPAATTTLTRPRIALNVPVALAPDVLTLPASGITSTGAVLNATVNPRGAPTQAWFEWGSTTNCANASPVQWLGNSSSNQTFTARLSGLASNTTIYFRVHATNLLGSALGAVGSLSRNPSRPALTANPDSGKATRGFHFVAAPGQIYQVETSTNLTTWQLIGTATDLGGGAFQFVDEATAAGPARFYRVYAP